MSTIGKEWQIPIFSEDEGLSRWKKIRERMGAREIDCLVVSGTTAISKASYADMRYITNFINWSDDEYCVFPFRGEPQLITYMVQHMYWAEKVSWVRDVITCSSTPFAHQPGIDIVSKIKALGLEKGTIGISNKRTMLAYVYEYLQNELPQARIVEAGEILRDCRRIKSPAEIEYVRHSGRCADLGFKAMINVARPGITDFDLAAECESAMTKAGAEVGSFTLFNSKRWPDGWGFPQGGTYRKLRKGDIILNEISPNYGGYFTQLCRPISLGEPSDDFKEMFDIHLKMYQIGRKDFRPGNYINDLDAQMQKYALAKRPFSQVWGGLQHLDSLNADPNFDLELKPGMVYEIHPWTHPPEADMKARKGHLGHILGDACICKDGPAESVSQVPIEITVV
jgi:Xaa-Pro aminopeptidase